MFALILSQNYAQLKVNSYTINTNCYIISFWQIKKPYNLQCYELANPKF